MLGNTYLAVATPTPAYLLVGHTPGNTYVGSSRAYDPIFQPVTVQPTDEIHVLPGGTFLVVGGAAAGELYWTLPSKHLFEYGPDPDVPPATLRRLPAGTSPAGGYRLGQATPDQAWVRAHAKPHGRGPVWVLDPA